MLALLARFRGPVFPVAVVTSMALPVDEGGDDVTILTTRRFPVFLDVALALLADAGRAALTET